MLRMLARTLLPAGLRRELRARHRATVLRRELRAFGASPLANAGDARFERLVYGWGNENWSAHGEYLRHIARRVADQGGAVLECGSGLSTLLLAAVAGRSGAHVWSLEHAPAWAARVRHALAHHGLSERVTVCDAPLVSYGDYTWYTPPADDAPVFTTVICDGPPGAVPGGRYGLLPVMRSRLAPDAVVLLDDAGRPEEQEILGRWRAEFGGQYRMLGQRRPLAEYQLG